MVPGKENMKRIILASKSPRREEILKKISDSFEIIVSDADEDMLCGNVFDIPERLALRKAESVFVNNSDSVVIGADTVVILENRLLTKPADEDDAKKMLRELSGKTHSVVTGCAVISEDRRISFTVETKVDFYDLTDEEIDEYVKTGEPMDKAGAYGIQGKGFFLVRGIEGDYYNVVGLPAARLKRELKGFLI